MSAAMAIFGFSISFSFAHAAPISTKDDPLQLPAKLNCSFRIGRAAPPVPQKQSCKREQPQGKNHGKQTTQGFFQLQHCIVGGGVGCRLGKLQLSFAESGQFFEGRFGNKLESAAAV